LVIGNFGGHNAIWLTLAFNVLIRSAAAGAFELYEQREPTCGKSL
jgi:hypothetical protein